MRGNDPFLMKTNKALILDRHDRFFPCTMMLLPCTTQHKFILHQCSWLLEPDNRNKEPGQNLHVNP